MRRRKFFSLAAGAAASSVAGAETLHGDQVTTKAARRPIRMVVGTQQGPTTAELLQFCKRHGVEHICGYPPDPGERGHWTLDDLLKTRDLCEKHGVTLDMVALPFLASSHIDRERRGAVMLGKSPERDRDIEHINIMTAHCAKAGIPAFKYNMSILGVLRTQSTPGRGGAQYSTWKLKDAKADPPLTRAGRVSADMAWERVTYFLDRVIPACNEHRVRAACHPHDPGVPPEGFQGVARVLGTVEGMRRFVSIQESPYHGLNFCLGTIAEMLEDPGRQIHDVIREFGKRGKIFNIHFRNIRGRRDDFQEVYVDNGDMDMLAVARTLAEVDFPYMLMPDHVPHHDNDPEGWQAFAYTFGYIKALLAAMAAEG